MIRSLLLIPLALLAAGCSSGPKYAPGLTNPSFSVTTAEAKADLKRMEHDEQPFDRPVIVAAGYMDPGLASGHIAELLRDVTTNRSMVIAVPFFSVNDFDSSRQRLVETVQRKFPSGDNIGTTEVDVVAVSMGGLVARYAAMEVEGEERLRIRRLYTISTPHLGANMADLPTWDARVRDMREGSDFLKRLDESHDPNAYELIAYVRTDDAMVGTRNAVPPSGEVWWLPDPKMSLGHVMAHRDPRILADIARRLRGEDPYTTEPPTPLPEPIEKSSTPEPPPSDDELTTDR